MYPSSCANINLVASIIVYQPHNPSADTLAVQATVQESGKCSAPAHAVSGRSNDMPVGHAVGQTEGCRFPAAVQKTEVVFMTGKLLLTCVINDITRTHAYQACAICLQVYCALTGRCIAKGPRPTPRSQAKLSRSRWPSASICRRLHLPLQSLPYYS